MYKRTKKQNNISDDLHIFSLKPLSTLCKFNKTILLSFCDNLKNKKKHKHSSLCLQYPVFNKDKNFGSPSFILKCQKQYYQQKAQIIKKDHLYKMYQYTDQKNSINIPKPRTKNSFCSVCREVYEDYLDHILSQKHKIKINSSVFNNHIIQMGEQFDHNNNKISISLSQHNLNTMDEDEANLQLAQNPIKKVKIDQELPMRHPYLQTQKSRHIEQIQPFMDYQMCNFIAPPPHINIYQKFNLHDRKNQQYFADYQQNQLIQINRAYQQFIFNYNMIVYLNNLHMYVSSHPLINFIMGNGLYYNSIMHHHVYNRVLSNRNLYIIYDIIQKDNEKNYG